MNSRELIFSRRSAALRSDRAETVMPTLNHWNGTSDTLVSSCASPRAPSREMTFTRRAIHDHSNYVISSGQTPRRNFGDPEDPGDGEQAENFRHAAA